MLIKNFWNKNFLVFLSGTLNVCAWIYFFNLDVLAIQQTVDFPYGLAQGSHEAQFNLTAEQRNLLFIIFFVFNLSISVFILSQL